MMEMTLAELAARVENEVSVRDRKIMASRRIIGSVKVRLTCDKGTIGVALDQLVPTTFGSEQGQTIYMTANEFARLMGWFNKHCKGFVPVDESLPDEATEEPAAEAASKAATDAR